MAETIKGIVDAGIPVCGHLGLTPQSIHQFGGYGLRAKEETEAETLMEDARRLQAAGCFAIVKLLAEAGCCGIVLEKIPTALAKRVTDELSIPVIGIGAGNVTDGQVLVGQDALGMSTMFKPKFVRRYLNLFDTIREAVAQYDADVKSGAFPCAEESY